jgi:hypothetical protein
MPRAVAFFSPTFQAGRTGTHKAPNGARLDSPGSSAAEPWVAHRQRRAKPQRGAIHSLAGPAWRAESRPVGPAGIVMVTDPGLRRLSQLRPGLSNLAPFGAFLPTLWVGPLCDTALAIWR